jgi:hypothetical protein
VRKRGPRSNFLRVGLFSFLPAREGQQPYPLNPCSILLNPCKESGVDGTWMKHGWDG